MYKQVLYLHGISSKLFNVILYLKAPSLNSKGLILDKDSSNIKKIISDLSATFEKFELAEAIIKALHPSCYRSEVCVIVTKGELSDIKYIYEK